MTNTGVGFLDQLNSEQIQAVLAAEGPVRVIAGPGTGKTRTLTARYCHLVENLDVPPKNILCATFTNRAAGEMKRRIRSTLGDLDLGYICTFHAFCVQLLREDGHVLNYPKNFMILDVEDQKQLLLGIFRDMGLTLRETTVKRTIDEVLEGKKLYASAYIDRFYLLNNEELKAKFHEADDRNEEIFLRYLYEQKKCFGLDFNDLINFAAYILSNFPDVRQKWQDRMQYVMVDEFQDVSERQYKIARVLSGKHGNLFIVGDPDQTIYSWRGSHVRLFLDFHRKYRSAKTVLLSVNYRSTPEILSAANALIEKNTGRFPLKLNAAKEKGPKPLYFHAPNEKAEAVWICDQIQKLAESGERLSDVAILYRAHYLSRALEEGLMEKGLPYRIYSGVGFYGRREIKDIICYLRMVTAGDDTAFLRTVNLPPRKIGKKKLDGLKTYAERKAVSLYEALRDNLDGEALRGTGAWRYVGAVEHARKNRFSEKMGNTLQTLLDMSGYEEFSRLEGDQERLDNIAELKRAVEKAGLDADATLEDFLEKAALFTNLDRDEKRETVKLMTIHTAKGMEFPAVFLCGLNEGVLPSRRSFTPEDMEEERRLAYVAATRAMTRLFLSDAEGFSEEGAIKYPSRFIFETGRENLDYVVNLDPAVIDAALRRIASDTERGRERMPLFAAGDRVTHPAFGIGTVRAVNTAELSYVICFESLKTERAVRFGGKLKKLEHDIFSRKLSEKELL